MSDKRLPIGIVLLLAGATLAFWCHRELAFYSQGAGWFAKQFSREQASKSSTYEAGRVAGIVIAVAGAALVGVAATRKR